MRKPLQTVGRTVAVARRVLNDHRQSVSYQRQIALQAVESFYLSLDLPRDKIGPCRISTKKHLMDLYEKNFVYERSEGDGCIFHHLERDIRVLVPFVGFNEYILLCWDVFFKGYRLKIEKPFVVVDIGSNLLNASLLFAQHPLCTKVFSYEIVPDVYRLSQRCLDLNPRLKHKICHFDFGLYNVDEDIATTYFPTRAGASGISEKIQQEAWLIAPMDNDFQSAENRIEVRAPVKKAYPVIKEIADRFPTHELVVKVDAENSECEILENLLPLFDRAYCFFVEIHLPESRPKIVSLFEGRNYTAEWRSMHTFYNKDRISRL